MKVASRIFAIFATAGALSAVVVGARSQEKPVPNKVSPLAPIEDVEGLPRVLLIGDSISIGYTLPVREKLRGKANVHRPKDNCGPTKLGLTKLDDWLATGGKGKEWDVIHFNWGLHDLKYLSPEGKNLADPADPKNHQQVETADYEKNLRELVARLKKTGAKLIWCSTTPVPEGARGRVAGDAEKYNAVAAKVMAESGIPTDDLFTFAKARLPKLQRPADVHFTAEGSEALAGRVVESILGRLSD